MEFGLNPEERNLICKATFKRKSDGNNIFGVKGYAKTIGARISKISIVVSNHIDKVYVRLNEVFDKIKDISKKVRD